MYVNNRWCEDVSVVGKHCSVAISFFHFLCSCWLFTFRWMHGVISRQETVYLDAVFIVPGDFNHCDLRNVLLMYHQNVCILTRENNIFDQVYSNVENAYKAVPRSHFGQSDPISVFLYPAYRQLLQ